ncbi:P-II family nitrogen regulator [Ferrovibrio sp.]|jgi:nitrogen regulatory protein PII|uniref:P-II family nitrogen regulator n=2 Tax=Ferrovibrio sp. TaxID=1917215 RepID=UPI0035B015DD
MPGHPRKKIEIIVEAPLQRSVLEWLSGQGVKGWSLLPRVIGGGQHGERSGDDVTRAFDNVMIVAVTTEPVARQVLDGFHQRFANAVAIVYISDVEVARPYRF